MSFTHLRSLIADDNTAALEDLARRKNEHLAYVSQARQRMGQRASFARENPDAVLMINVDGMDQAKTNIPNESLKDKGGSVGQPLAVRLMGAIAYGRGWYGFWSVPQWGASSNVTLTALDYIISDVLKEGMRRGVQGSHLPPRLVIQMDNTAKDNKNHNLLGFAGMLLSEGYFQEVEAHFLPVGHTHQEIDQSFSLVSKAIKQQGALDLEDLMVVAGRAWEDLEYVGGDGKQHVLLDAVQDYRRAFRHQVPRRLAKDAETQDLDPDEEPMNMYHFHGLGSDRRKDKDQVSRRLAPATKQPSTLSACRLYMPIDTCPQRFNMDGNCALDMEGQWPLTLPACTITHVHVGACACQRKCVIWVMDCRTRRFTNPFMVPVVVQRLVA